MAAWQDSCWCMNVRSMVALLSPSCPDNIQSMALQEVGAGHLVNEEQMDIIGRALYLLFPSLLPSLLSDFSVFLCSWALLSPFKWEAMFLCSWERTTNGSGQTQVQHQQIQLGNVSAVVCTFLWDPYMLCWYALTLSSPHSSSWTQHDSGQQRPLSHMPFLWYDLFNDLRRTSLKPILWDMAVYATVKRFLSILGVFSSWGWFSDEGHCRRGAVIRVNNLNFPSTLLIPSQQVGRICVRAPVFSSS